jgi:oligogalacturonide lyase
MAKGDKGRFTFKSYRDNETGRIVTKLTTDKFLNHHPYFYNKMITNDNRSLIFSSNRDGLRNLYKLDLISGETKQLTEGENISDFSPILTNDNKHLVFCRGERIILMDIVSLEEEVIYETPKGWVSGENPSISSDNRYLVLVEMNEKDHIKGQGDWSTFEPQWAQKPHCRIVYINIADKTSIIPYEDEHCWLGHPQIRPGANNTILFCHEGPGNRIDARLWLVDVGDAIARSLKPQSHSELITHEYWLNDGSRLAYVYRNYDTCEETIRFMNPDTMEEEVLMQCSTFCHFISNKDNTKIIGDGQNPVKPYLYLVDVNSKIEEKLCIHGSSFKSYGNTQDSHPHPAFSPDGKYVIFTSDMDGMPGIYKVEL